MAIGRAIPDTTSVTMITLSLSLSHTHTHAYTYAHTYTHTHTHTHTQTHTPLQRMLKQTHSSALPVSWLRLETCSPRHWILPRLALVGNTVVLAVYQLDSQLNSRNYELNWICLPFAGKLAVTKKLIKLLVKPWATSWKTTFFQSHCNSKGFSDQLALLHYP